MAGPNDTRRAEEAGTYADEVFQDIARMSFSDETADLQRQIVDFWNRFSSQELKNPQIVSAIESSRGQFGLRGMINNPALASTPELANVLKIVRPNLIRHLRDRLMPQVDLDLNSLNLVETVQYIRQAFGNRALMQAGSELRFSKSSLRELLLNLRLNRQLQRLDSCHSLAELCALAVTPGSDDQRLNLDCLRVSLAEIDPQYGVLHMGGGPAGTPWTGGLQEWIEDPAQVDAKKRLNSLVDPALLRDPTSKQVHNTEDNRLLLAYLKSNPEHANDLKAEYDEVLADSASTAVNRTPHVKEQENFNKAATLIDQIHAAEHACHLRQMELENRPPPSDARKTVLSTEIADLLAQSLQLRNQFQLDHSTIFIPPYVSLTNTITPTHTALPSAFSPSNLASHNQYLSDLKAQGDHLRVQAGQAVDIAGTLPPAELLRRLIERDIGRRNHNTLPNNEVQLRSSQAVVALREKLLGSHLENQRSGDILGAITPARNWLDRIRPSLNIRKYNDFLEETIYADPAWESLKGILVPNVSVQALLQTPLDNNEFKRLIETFDLLLGDNLSGTGRLAPQNRETVRRVRDRMFRAYLVRVSNDEMSSTTPPANSAEMLTRLLATRPSPNGNSANSVALNSRDPKTTISGYLKHQIKTHGPTVVTALANGWKRLKTDIAQRLAKKKAKGALPPPPPNPAP